MTQQQEQTVIILAFDSEELRGEFIRWWLMQGIRVFSYDQELSRGLHITSIPDIKNSLMTIEVLEPPK